MSTALWFHADIVADLLNVALEPRYLAHDVGACFAEFIEKVGAQLGLTGFQASQRPEDQSWHKPPPDATWSGP
jgi:hypothetical protein